MITLEDRETMAQRAIRVLSGDVYVEDYLTLTEKIEAAAARQVALARDWGMGTVGPNLLSNKQREEMLIHYHSGEHIGYVEDSIGIIVIAVGLDKISEVLREVPAEDRSKLILTRPPSHLE